jgi:hypothetical protein
MLGIVKFVLDFGAIVSIIVLNVSNIVSMHADIEDKESLQLISREMLVGGVLLFAFVVIIKILLIPY